VAGAPNGLDALPPELSRQVLEILARRTDWALTESGTGFLLRIARGGEPVGVVVLDRFEFPEHRGRYVNLALSIAGVAGLAIDNARTYAQVAGTQEALRKSEISLKLAQAMAHVGHWEVDVDTGEVRWSEETYRILGYEPGMLSPSYEAFTRAIHPADRQFVARHVDAARGGGGFDIEFRVVLPDARVRVLHGMGQMIQLESGPQRRILGTVQLVTPRERPELLGVLQDITNVKEMQWRLEQEARSDPLTGCANRRYFLELAGGEVARARRYPEEVSVLMLDLDHFKDINDRHGHAAGDLVLQRLVLTCRAALREEDAIGRLGGEEFAILLPQTGADRALEVAERLRVAVAGVEIAADGGPPIRFTTSIGVATLAEGDLGVGALLARADRALYEAKSRGRNRVVGAAGPPPRRRRASA
jgi:diguanylate cyclase (GGDEF)-like protein